MNFPPTAVTLRSGIPPSNFPQSRMHQGMKKRAITSSSQPYENSGLRRFPNPTSQISLRVFSTCRTTLFNGTKPRFTKRFAWSLLQVISDALTYCKVPIYNFDWLNCRRLFATSFLFRLSISEGHHACPWVLENKGICSLVFIDFKGRRDTLEQAIYISVIKLKVRRTPDRIARKLNQYPGNNLSLKNFS